MKIFIFLLLVLHIPFSSYASSTCNQELETLLSINIAKKIISKKVFRANKSEISPLIQIVLENLFNNSKISKSSKYLKKHSKELQKIKDHYLIRNKEPWVELTKQNNSANSKLVTLLLLNEDKGLLDTFTREIINLISRDFTLKTTKSANFSYFSKTIAESLKNTTELMLKNKKQGIKIVDETNINEIITTGKPHLKGIEKRIKILEEKVDLLRKTVGNSQQVALSQKKLEKIKKQFNILKNESTNPRKQDRMKNNMRRSLKTSESIIKRNLKLEGIEN